MCAAKAAFVSCIVSASADGAADADSISGAISAFSAVDPFHPSHTLSGLHFAGASDGDGHAGALYVTHVNGSPAPRPQFVAGMAAQAAPYAGYVSDQIRAFDPDVRAARAAAAAKAKADAAAAAAADSKGDGGDGDDGDGDDEPTTPPAGSSASASASAAPKRRGKKKTKKQKDKARATAAAAAAPAPAADDGAADGKSAPAAPSAAAGEADSKSAAKASAERPSKFALGDAVSGEAVQLFKYEWNGATYLTAKTVTQPITAGTQASLRHHALSTMSGT
jgi:hypothetical protein